MEIRKGPRKCNRRLARKCFERVVELAEGAGNPDGPGLAKRAKEKLLFLDDHDRPRRGAAAPPPFGPPDDAAIDVADLFEASTRSSARLDIDGKEPLPGGSPGKLFEMFARMCREAGVDPNKVLDEAAAGTCLSASAPRTARTPKRNRK